MMPCDYNAARFNEKLYDCASEMVRRLRLSMWLVACFFRFRNWLVLSMALGASSVTPCC